MGDGQNGHGTSGQGTPERCCFRGNGRLTHWSSAMVHNVKPEDILTGSLLQVNGQGMRGLSKQCLIRP